MGLVRFSLGSAAIAFLRELNAVVHHQCPGTLMIAEESTSWPRVTGPVEEGCLGFDMKWNMGWMNDSLSYMARDPLYRQHHPSGRPCFSRDPCPCLDLSLYSYPSPYPYPQRQELGCWRPKIVPRRDSLVHDHAA